MQLIFEAEGTQDEVLEVVLMPKPGEKSIELSPLTRFKWDVRQTKAVQVGHLSKMSGDFT